jgi:hypothetical protein
VLVRERLSSRSSLLLDGKLDVKHDLVMVDDFFCFGQGPDGHRSDSSEGEARSPDRHLRMSRMLAARDASPTARCGICTFSGIACRPHTR